MAFSNSSNRKKHEQKCQTRKNNHGSHSVILTDDDEDDRSHGCDESISSGTSPAPLLPYASVSSAPDAVVHANQSGVEGGEGVHRGPDDDLDDGVFEVPTRPPVWCRTVATQTDDM